MNPHVNTISNRLSLRPPQRDSLEILVRVCEIVPLKKDGNPAQALDIIKSEFSTTTKVASAYGEGIGIDRDTADGARDDQQPFQKRDLQLSARLGHARRFCERAGGGNTGKL